MRLGRTGFVLALLAFGACGDGDSGEHDAGLGANTPLPWVDSSTSGSAASADTPLLWNDPSSGPSVMLPPDPTDLRTYTSPDIYILGNRHPLMTHVTARTHQAIVAREERVITLLNEFRYAEYVRLIGSPLPANSRLIVSPFLRQNARAHAKHYAVWVPGTPLPLVNEEGDSVWYSNPIPLPGIELRPDLTPVSGSATGRLPKSKIAVDLAGQLVGSGPDFFDPDALARHWITTYPDFLRYPSWTHFGVGYWSNIGNGINHYWNAVFARNPRLDVPLPDPDFNLF